MSKIKTIGVLTSGGDAPGMNAAIRAVARTAAYHGITCLGIRRGYNGLINGDVVELNARSVNGIISKGGTMLFTARCPEFMTPEGIKKGADTCKYLGIDGIVTIGGDGTFRGARDLAANGVHTIGVPATIDNDISSTEYSIGFDTACNTALDAIDKLRDTMQSHERCSVVEVMGHNAGHLALHVAIACGAQAVLVPEKPFDFQRDVVEKIRAGRINKRSHFIIIQAEGVGNSIDITKRIVDETGIDTRLTILGHIQ
ncbi:MAG: 6-phosphofructokinase, partial [Oscillospiraceae bacterium]|nr:6-phosphofructokinase [Oscillospiraceae bacterium]